MTEPTVPIDPFHADCGRCQGLCCVAHAHRREDGFPHPKAQADPCRNLDLTGFGCRVFDRLEAEGYTTCRGYECFGAGPQVTRRFERPWPAMPADERARYFDQFRRLSRLRCLLDHMNRRTALAGHPLRLALNRVVAEYDRTGTLPEPQEVTAILAAHPDLARRMLAEVGYRGPAGA